MNNALQRIKKKIAEGSLIQAKKECEKLLLEEPSNLSARETLGLILQHQGDLKAAEKLFKELVTAAPEFINAHIALATIYSEQGNTEASNKCLQNASRIKVSTIKESAKKHSTQKSITEPSEQLPLLPRGQPFNFKADRFSIWGQEIAFMTDPLFINSWNKVITKTSPHINDSAVYKIFWRAHIAVSIISQIQRKDLVIAECGVHLGHLMQTIMHYFKDKKNIELHLFDTFRGIPLEQIEKNESLAHWHNKNNYKGDYYKTTKNFFKEFKEVKFHKGKIPDTLAKFNNSHVDFVSIDMNIVAPEKAALEFFWPKIRFGGAVLIDDYGFQKHTAQQIMYDDFFSRHGIIPMQLPTGQAVVFKN